MIWKSVLFLTIFMVYAMGHEMETHPNVRELSNSVHVPTERNLAGETFMEVLFPYVCHKISATEYVSERKFVVVAFFFTRFSGDTYLEGSCTDMCVDLCNEPCQDFTVTENTCTCVARCNVNAVCLEEVDICECSSGFDGNGQVCCDKLTQTFNETLVLCVEKTALRKTFEETINDFTLSLFPDAYLEAIALDSPNGFVLGSINVTNMNNTIILEDYPDYPFLACPAAVSGAIRVDGFFFAEGRLPNDTLVHIYSLDGSSSSGLISSVTGYFSVTLVDIPLGQHPFLITASSRNGPSQRHLSSSVSRTLPMIQFRPPTTLKCEGSRQCPPLFSVTLTWDKPSSDVDLHVYEPGGAFVYFRNKRGLDGFLDVDDVNGFGPEHYYGEKIRNTENYVVRVHLYGYDSAAVLPVRYKVIFRNEFGIVWENEGELSATTRYSPDYYFNFSGAANTTRCASCSNFEDAEDRMLQGASSDWLGEVPKCESCLSRTTGYLWWTDSSEEWKLYESMLEVKDVETIDGMTVSFFYTMLISGIVNKTQYGNAFTQQRNNIEATQDLTKLRCAMFHIMKTFCTIQNLNQSIEFIKAIRKLKSLSSSISTIGGSAAQNFEEISKLVKTAIETYFGRSAASSIIAVYTTLKVYDAIYMALVSALDTNCGIPLPF